MLATNMSDATSSEEKLRWAFKMYDQDSSGLDEFLLSGYALDFPLGTIDVEEMMEIVGNLYEVILSYIGIIYCIEKFKLC